MSEAEFTEDIHFLISLNQKEKLDKTTREYGLENRAELLRVLIEHGEDILSIWLEFKEDSKKAARKIKVDLKTDYAKEAFKLRSKVEDLQGELKELKKIMQSSGRIKSYFYAAKYEIYGTCPKCGIEIRQSNAQPISWELISTPPPIEIYKPDVNF